MNSFYKIYFEDGSSADSEKISWYNCAEKIKVKRGNRYKLVYASTAPIKSILVHHNNLEKKLDVPEGHRVFQAICARTNFVGNSTTNEILGRIVGLIKGNEVVEEYNLSSESDSILGFKI